MKRVWCVGGMIPTQETTLSRCNFAHRKSCMYCWPHELKQDLSCDKVTLVQALRLCTGHTARRGSRGIALPFHDHGTRKGWGVSVTPRPLFTPGKDPVPIVQEVGWAPRPVWTGAENLAPTGIRSPDLLAHKQLLYRLRYPAHSIGIGQWLNPWAVAWFVYQTSSIQHYIHPIKIIWTSLKFVANSSDTDIYHVIITFQLQDLKLNLDFWSMTSGCVGYIH